METGLRTASGEKPVLPETVPVPGGFLGRVNESGPSPPLAIAPFRIGRVPVTNREYAPFVAAGRAAAPPWWNDPRFHSPLQPVVGVTWDEAVSFCAWLGESDGGRWRLPTESEWELAASGGLAAPRTPWGETLPAREIPSGPIEGPWETGRGTPNGYGLLDPGTVVHEWCSNWFDPGRASAAGPPSAIRRRASRGGSWRHEVRWSAPGERSSLPPGYRYSDFGFRVLREADR